ncbi:MAG: asparagine synthase (glutamine-hydrolyzing) [Oscillospiraceae bacterium]|nr:asparagine synthase (glutamine-hydrolyzing) [Oscillospiraceae bacterium]
MCGIAGEISPRLKKQTAMEDYQLEMQRELWRRGPDQRGFFSDDGAALIHTRLSVIDLENGLQPMTRDGYTIVYNGELYNTDDIRNRCKERGVVFSTASDTEVVLRAYMELGEDCLNLFNGIFAFAVWNGHELFVARDRMGVKPFFYAETGGGFVFASSVAALLRHKDIKPIIDIGSVKELFLIGPGRTPGCGVLKGIKELPPACCGMVKDGKLNYRKYWELRQREHTDTLPQTIERTRELVVSAIKRQLVSDIPIFTFLSGGLDSSIISAVAAKELAARGKELHTYSVDYVDNGKYFTPGKFQPNSDEAYINMMNSFLGVTNHRILIDTPELTQALFEAVDARGLPGMVDVDSSLLVFAREIKKNFSVGLSGECADEIFGGYPWYRDETIRMAEGFPWSQSTMYRYSFLRPELQSLIAPQDYVSERYYKTVSEAHKLSGNSPTDDRMKEMMRLNFDWFMQTLLGRKDFMTMYSGVEARVPFCDISIVEYMYSVPWDYMNYEGREKGLLRKAMEGLLPEEVLWRKKSPYPKTHNPGYLKAVSGLLREVIEDSGSPLLSLADKAALEGLFTADKAQPWYGQLMTTPQTIAYMLQINYWMRKYDVKVEI